MLKLLFAPPHVDLCGELIKRNAACERFFLIVPRHYSHECERRLCEVLGDGASQHAEVLSIDRLFTRVATECGGTARVFLDDAGKLLVAYSAAQQVSSQMRAFGGELRKPEFLAEALRLIDEMRSCQVDIDMLIDLADGMENEDLGARLHDIAFIAESYSVELTRRGTPADRVDALCDLLDGGWANDKTFAFFGYTEFNEQELEVVRRLLHSRDVTVALSCDRELMAPMLGEDDPLYIYARTAARLRRLAESEGVAVETEDIIQDDPRPDDLAYISSEFAADETAGFDGTSSAVTLAAERSVWNECERAAAYILDTVRKEGWKFRDFAVALPDGEEYAGAMEAVFGSWGIPVFMDSTDPALSTPVIAALSAALDMLCGGFANEDVLRFIKSGLSPLNFEASCEVENYAYTWQISSGKWLRDWTGNPRGFSTEFSDADRATLDKLNRRRRMLVEPFERFRSRIRPGEVNAVSEILRAFYDLMCDLRLDRRIEATARSYARAGELKTAGEYSQLWGKICDLLDEFAELAGDEQMKFTEFAQLFELLLSGVRIGSIPAALDGVPVGEVGRLRHRRPKALLILGARAGLFPPAVTSGGLLDDNDREELAELDIGLEPSSRKLAWRSIDTALSALNLPSQRLYVSWSPSTDGGDAIPSPLIARLANALHVTIQPPSDDRRLLYAKTPAMELAMRAVGGNGDEVQKAALEYFSSHDKYVDAINAARAASDSRRGPLDADTAGALYGDDVRLNASRSDLFMGCSFSHFCRYGLGAKPRHRAELDALESGTLIHSVLENTVRRANDTGLLSGVIGDRENSAAREIAHDELGRYIVARLGEAADDARTVRLVERIKGSLDRVVSSIMDEFASSEFRPVGFEVGFGTRDAQIDAIPVGHGSSLVGVVDRVDEWTDPETGKKYFRVIDYKSGNKHFDYTDISHGVSLQLPIYLHALKQYAAENDVEIDEAGAFYTPAAEPYLPDERGLDDETVEDKLREKERRSGVYLGEPSVVAALESGTNRFLPTSPNYKLTKAKFEMLESFVERKMREVAHRIADGEIEAAPSVRGERSACDYCDFAAACRFDSTIKRDSDHMRYRTTISPDSFWNSLEEGGDGNA